MSGRDDWRRGYEAAAVGRARAPSTPSGIPLEPVYGPDDGEWPGVFPYTRGPYASMYRTKLWTHRMFAGFGSAAASNRRIRDLLDAGGVRAYATEGEIVAALGAVFGEWAPA